MERARINTQASNTFIAPDFVQPQPFQIFPAERFPSINPVWWLNSHFAVGGWSPLRKLSGMLTAHMTQIAPRAGFTWHPHSNLEIYTWMLEGTLSHEDTTGGKGDIGPGELQRMFSGDYIEHQELNRSDSKARVIQIWFVADAQYQGLKPHYQQLSQAQLPVQPPAQHSNGATTHHLIGGGSPMDSHVKARLTATTVQPGGIAKIAPPHMGESLFLYVTDGQGQARHMSQTGALTGSLNQYDVILAGSDAAEAEIASQGDQPLQFMSFYLPAFL